MRPIVKTLLWIAAAIAPLAIAALAIVRADRAQELAAAEREAERSAQFIARIVRLTAGVGNRQLEAFADSPSFERAIDRGNSRELDAELELFRQNPAWLGLVALGPGDETIASAGQVLASDLEAVPEGAGVTIVPRLGFNPARAVIATPVLTEGMERAWLVGTYSLAELDAELSEPKAGGRTVLVTPDGTVLLGTNPGQERVVLETEGAQLRVRDGDTWLAAAVVPLFGGNVRAVSLQDPQAFGQQTMAAVAGLGLAVLLLGATITAWSLRTWRAEQRLQVRERELAALQELATDATSSWSRDQVIRMAGARAAQLLDDVEATFVVMAVPEPGWVQLYCTYPAPREPRLVPVEGNLILTRVLQHGRRESGKTPAAAGSPWAEAGFDGSRWEVWTPLVAHGRILGAVACLSRQERRDGAAEEERLLEGLAATTAVALESHERLAELAHQRAMLAIVVDASPDALLALDADNRVLLDNPAARTLGRVSSFVGKTVDEVVESIERRGGTVEFDYDYDQELARARAGTTTRGSFRIAFGTQTHAMESVMAPLPLPETATGCLVSMRDVSERAELEQVRMLHQQVTLLARQAAGRAVVLEQVLAASELGLVFLDHEGRVAYANDRFGELAGMESPATGTTAEELVGVLRERLGPDFEDLRKRTVLHMPGPARKIIAMRAVEVRDAEGRNVGTLVSLRDETAQRELEEARESFIGVAAHELKNPLAVLRIQAERGLRDPERSTESLERILVRTAQLQELVERLLDATRAELNKLSLERAHIDVTQLVRDAAEPFVAQGAPISIEAEGAVWAFVDPVRVKQVVTNLVSNAVRYGGEQPIAVRVWSRADEARIAVEDRGPGIPLEEQQHIFERFGQGRSATRGPGLGIGLYLAQRIAQAHGGRVELTSRPGAGSTFTVVLPVHPPPDYGAAATTQEFA